MKKKDKFITNPNNELSFYEQILFQLNRLPKTYRISIFSTSFCTEEAGYLEINSNWYFRHHKAKFFNSYDKFMSTFLAIMFQRNI